MINDCQKCQDHDDKTKALTKELFGLDEQMLLSMLLANSIVNRNRDRKAMPLHENNREMKKLLAQRDIDFAATVLVKLMLAFDDVTRKKVEKVLVKLGLVIKVKHEKCPHKEESHAEEKTPGT